MTFKTVFNSNSEIIKQRGLENGGKVQKAIDSEVLLRSDPYVPFRTGALKKSGILGTKIGSGEVIYNAIYADKQYYHNAGKGNQGTATGGLRGRFWFERMKTQHLDDILNTAKKACGGK
jgi:hypothetical protein